MKLYLVGTPIGNLEDMTQRSLRVLNEIDHVFCEDTRRTKGLLEHFSLKCKCIHLSKLNEKQSLKKVIALLEENIPVAYVSDAGMPLISDPGFFLVNAVRTAGFEVELVPGPSSLCSAITYSGFVENQFLFLGFLPDKKKQIISYIEPYINVDAELVIFVSPHKIKKQIPILAELLGSRSAILCKELTKIHESMIPFKLSDLPETQFKGEFVLLIKRAENQIKNTVNSLSLKKLGQEIAELGGIGIKQKANMLSLLTGESKKDIYERLLKSSKP